MSTRWRSQQYFNQAAAELTYHTAQRALDYAPREYASARGLAWVFLGAGLFLAHGKEQALAALATGLEKGQVTHGYEYSRVLIIRCFVYWMAADLHSLEQTAAELLPLCAAAQLTRKYRLGPILSRLRLLPTK